MPVRPRIVAIVHVFYPEMWPELAVCIRNLGPCDLTVTYVDETAVSAAHRDFPDARFILCENRGYDVWPFLKALKLTDVSRYDLVVKLHTKRDMSLPHPLEIGGLRLNGSAWREHLLSFVKTPAAWAKTVGCFEDPRVGLVAGRRLFFGRREGGKDAFDRACRELHEKFGLTAGRGGLFVGGTMFAVRPSVLKPFVDYPFEPEMFTPSGPHELAACAHIVERMLGLAVGAQGFRVAGFDGSVSWWRSRKAVSRFVCERRWSDRRRSVRIFGITVYLKRLSK